MSKTVVVTGASHGLGALIAGGLADAGHRVYADVTGADPWNRAAPAPGGRPGGGALYPVALDKTDQQSVRALVDREETGAVDVVVHCAGPVPFGPAESFTPFQLFDLYDGSVLSAQRVNRALLPLMRERGAGLLVWVGSSADEASSCLGLHTAVRSAALQMARSYADELARFGVETSIVRTGPAAPPAAAGPDALVLGDDTTTRDAYAKVVEDARNALAELGPPPWDPGAVTRAVLAVIDAPEGRRPRDVNVEP